MSNTWAATLKWARTVHIYMTLAAMVLLLFFATTGFLMNHADWFRSGKPPRVEEVKLPAEALTDQFTIVEYLRAKLGCQGEAKFVEPRPGRERAGEGGGGGQRKTVQFRAPGRTADVVITMETGDAKISRQDQGIYGVLTDMHKGKQATGAWKLLTDVTAFMLAGAVVTGFVIWIALKKRRVFGIVGLALSVAIAGTLFMLAVR